VVCTAQSLIDVLFTSAEKINITFIAKKSVCVVFNPTLSRKSLTYIFPAFTAGDDEFYPFYGPMWCDSNKDLSID